MKRKSKKFVTLATLMLIAMIAALAVKGGDRPASAEVSPIEIEYVEKQSGLSSLGIFSSEFGAANAVPPLPLASTPDNYSDYSDTPDITNEIILEIQKAGGSGSKLQLLSGVPQALIYHTHTTEAYRPAYEGEYKESSAWRTNNNDKNITAVGEALRQELEKYGINSIHDYTNHEPPKLATSYSRSVLTMEKYKKQYPNMPIYIDVHRDAANVETNADDVVVVDGKRCARVMFVVGAGTSDSLINMEKPNYKENYQLALNITNTLNKLNPKFTRPIRVKSGRYNQHISSACLLIEVGHNANTLQEALNSIPYVAKAIAQCVSIKK